ncbi:hypothetical protein J40TS1_07740 [Paenibacillus montaniterrae]|uniref:Thioredoxin domain-containing protein n=1 Tax=Paenibacillus montaniterrae TaxID=429341 RepID=A0A919YKV8_9BACL|nr:thioredoxin fold domain-containing protein [Paenibacillus montaniterrae]GIP15132.1 hypothetical protein J40TS1_07740 [Paenibacillus montaniterrae]
MYLFWISYGLNWCIVVLLWIMYMKGKSSRSTNPDPQALAEKNLIGSIFPIQIFKTVDQRFVSTTSREYTVLFFVTPECDGCKKIITELEGISGIDQDNLIMISFGEESDAKALVENLKIRQPVTAYDFKYVELFGVNMLPYAVIVNANGIVIAKGEIDFPSSLAKMIDNLPSF